MAANFFERFAPQHALRFIEDFAPSEKMIKPIEHFETVPIVSIEEAVDPLISLVPDVKEMVSKAKEKCSNPKDDLTIDESTSIMLYSLEWEPRKQSFYIILNKTLRAEDQEKLKPWQLYLKLFITSLEKLPSVSQTIYRGVKKNLSDQYPQGKTFVWQAFSSCTTSIHVLQSEQFLGKTGTRTLFNITCQSGKDIQQHSFFPTEDEVLLITSRKFQVVSSLDSGNDLFIIQLKEVESDDQLLGSSREKSALGPSNSTSSPLRSREDSSRPEKPALPNISMPPQFSASHTPPKPPRFPL